MEAMLDFVLQNLRTILISSVILLVLCWNHYFNGKKKWEQLPPGPPKLPLVGSLPFLGADIREPLRKMAQKYGDMMTVYLGSRQIIYLNKYDVIKEAFVKHGNSFTGRPQDLLWSKDICQCKGLLASEGELWREQRRFTHTVLKDFGMGRGILEPKIHEEIQSYFQVLESYNGKPMDPHFLTMKAIANIIFSIVSGNRNDYSDEYFNEYVRSMTEGFKILGESGILMVFPFLKYLPGDPFSIKKVFDFKRENDVKFHKMIQAHRESCDPENPRDYIDTYITRMDEERKVNPNSTFSEAQLMQTIGDLFGAGTETTSNTLLWSIKYMLNYPDVMKRCQAEIDDVIGRHRVLSLKDKASLPYVEATLIEIQRVANVVPLGVPHTAVEDVEFKGYYFPKGTCLMPNLYTLHMDPVTWPEPEVFNPSRHLTAEGKLFKREEFIPFSIGRRVCIGESLAKMEFFLFFTSMLQKFDLILPEGEPLPPLQGTLGATHIPLRFNIIFKKRH